MPLGPKLRYGFVWEGGSDSDWAALGEWQGVVWEGGSDWAGTLSIWETAAGRDHSHAVPDAIYGSYGTVPYCTVDECEFGFCIELATHFRSSGQKSPHSPVGPVLLYSTMYSTGR